MPVLPDEILSSDEERELDEAVDRFAAAIQIWRKLCEGTYDVFLCHNSEDKSAVRGIAKRLRKRGYLPWFDEWNLRPGTSWQRELQERIDTVRSAAIFVGSSGVGPWQQVELEGLLGHFVKGKRPVIPVILPGCSETPKLPIFLGNITWVDFRLTDPDPLDNLIWGITGRSAGHN